MGVRRPAPVPDLVSSLASDFDLLLPTLLAHSPSQEVGGARDLILRPRRTSYSLRDLGNFLNFSKPWVPPLRWCWQSPLPTLQGSELVLMKQPVVAWWPANPSEW